MAPASKGIKRDSTHLNGGHDVLAGTNQNIGGYLENSADGKQPFQPSKHLATANLFLAHEMSNKLAFVQSKRDMRLTASQEGSPVRGGGPSPGVSNMGATSTPPSSNQMAKEIMGRTVLLTFPRGQLITRHHFIDPLQELGIDLGLVEALGTLNHNNEWHLTFSTSMEATQIEKFCYENIVIHGIAARIIPILTCAKIVRPPIAGIAAKLDTLRARAQWPRGLRMITMIPNERDWWGRL